MNLGELAEQVANMVKDATRNNMSAYDVQVKVVTNRGSVKDIRGTRIYDVRTDCPVILVK